MAVDPVTVAAVVVGVLLVTGVGKLGVAWLNNRREGERGDRAAAAEARETARWLQNELMTRESALFAVYHTTDFWPEGMLSEISFPPERFLALAVRCDPSERDRISDAISAFHEFVLKTKGGKRKQVPQLKELIASTDESLWRARRFGLDRIAGTRTEDHRPIDRLPGELAAAG